MKLIELGLKFATEVELGLKFATEFNVGEECHIPCKMAENLDHPTF